MEKILAKRTSKAENNEDENIQLFMENSCRLQI